MKLTLPPSSLVPDPTTDYARAVVAGEIVAGPHVRASCARHLRDMEVASERGLTWDAKSADRALRFFPTVLRLSEGQFDGQPFNLHPAQAFIVGSLFGWKRADGTRRFRRAYIEQGKGNGKSPLAGGIGLYGMMADDEPGAQIFAAAAKMDQARILFNDAVGMVRQSPMLEERITPTGINPVNNLAWQARGSFFRPVGRDTGKTGSGMRPHFVLLDELHEHPNRDTLELLERGFKFRRQPLIFMITNSGSDRNSICWEEHEHAVKVAHGEVDDDTTFSYVCALDEARTVIYPVDISLRHALEHCSCSAQTTQIDLPSPEDFAGLVTSISGGAKNSSKASAAKITLTDRLLREAFATLATQGGANRTTRSAAMTAAPSCGNTSKAIGQENLPESEMPNTGQRKKPKTQRGKPTERERENTAYPPSKPLSLNLSKAGGAEFVEAARSVFGWTTATIQALSEVFSVTSATLELVCSETLRLLFQRHSDTCKIHQRFRLELKGLAEDLPADDPLEDPSCWIKANPLLGVTITESYLADVAAQARAIPGKANGIRRLHFCQWTDAESAWIAMETWQACEDESLSMADFVGQEVWLGLDLGATKDMTARVAIFRDGEDGEGRPKFAMFAHGYTPADTLHGRVKEDRAPYDVWVDQGHLTATPGKVVRFDHVAADIVDLASEYEIAAIAYDRWLIRNFEETLDELGVTLPLIEHPQGTNRRKDSPLWMPDSINMFEQLLLERRLRIAINPALRSAVMSSTFWMSPAGLRRFEKQRATARIDMAVAAAMAIGAAVSAEQELPSVYTERGALVL